MPWPPDEFQGDARDDKIQSLATENWMLKREIDKLKHEVDTLKQQLRDQSMKVALDAFRTAMQQYDMM